MPFVTRKLAARSWAGLLVLTVLLSQTTTNAADPLHVRVDAAITAADDGPPAAVVTDAEFVRRLYLTLTGAIPSVDETRKFLGDTSPNKRAELVDRLLSSPRFTRHLANVFDVMLMERLAEKHVKSNEWQQFLLTSLEQNKPFNQLAAEILGADGVDPASRAAAKFYLERDVEPHSLTREVGRMFFGLDVQCCQCHDHPLIDDYHQSDYYGLYAFVNRSFLFQPDNKQPAVLAEKGEGDANYKSVFTSAEGQTRPHLPGQAEIDEPAFAVGEEYTVKPDPKDKKIRPVPKYSRRQQLAGLVRQGANATFRCNIVNRLWAHMMGSGLVDPVDLHHSDNPPSHPQLLEMLADEFAAMNFDIKSFLRELALTQVFQRSVELPAETAARSQQAESRKATFETERQRMAAELADAEKLFEQFESQLTAATGGLKPVTEELNKANALVAEAKKVVEPAVKAVAEAEGQLVAKQAVVTPLSDAAAIARKASSLLQGDSEVASIADLLEQRSKKSSDDVAAAVKTVAEKTAAAKMPSEKLVAAETAARDVQPRYAAEQQKVAAAKQQFQSVREKRQAANAAVRITDRRIATEVALTNFGKQPSPSAAAQVAANPTAAALPSVPQSAAETTSASQQPAELAEPGQNAAPVGTESQEPSEKANVNRAAFESAYQDLTRFWSRQFVVRPLAPLTPEQMAWSVMQAVGMVDRQLAAEAAEFDKKTPLMPEEQSDPQKVAARQAQIERAVFDKLKGNVVIFVNLFGAGAGQPQSDFFATVDQALFFSNGGEVRNWLAPGGGNLTDRLSKLDDPKSLADELYLCVLTRHPTDAEIADVTDYLTSRPNDKGAAVQEIVWALLTSTEFRFNH